MNVLLLPGLYDSGPAHWQSRWEDIDPRAMRVVQDDWATPRCADWTARLSEVMRTFDDDVALVGHSSSCAMVAHWTLRNETELLARVIGALLVAPSDPLADAYPEGPSGFAPVPLHALPFPSIVVASDDDPYVSLDMAQSYARAWGSRFEHIGSRGHVNGESGLGEWMQGREWLDAMCGGTDGRQ